ncbi:hypothetical protein E4U58_004868 [Claviceps cyperi]|nr:hypothetical protein E4U58_004868 [Claviceps cyperi]
MSVQGSDRLFGSETNCLSIPLQKGGTFTILILKLKQTKSGKYQTCRSRLNLARTAILTTPYRSTIAIMAPPSSIVLEKGRNY